jgi:peptidyl-prolyl cis-trans isomerase A (cyclophilin A)
MHSTLTSLSSCSVSPRFARLTRAAVATLLVSALAACGKTEPAPAPAAEPAPANAGATGRPPPPTPEEIAANAKAAAAPAEATPAAAPAEATPAAVAPGAPAAVAAPSTAPAAPGTQHPAMKDPKLATEKAPETFKITFKTTKGDITVQVNRAWSPVGADRFYNLVKIGYFKDVAFFRAIAGFMAQFGIHGDPAVNNVWKDASIQDDPPAGQSNRKYTLTFAKKGMPNSRSVQFFINYKDNTMLDGMGFTPIGEVVAGKEAFDKINTQYGEGAPRGMGPDQMRVQTEGNAYLKKDFPALDYILSAEIAK